MTEEKLILVPLEAPKIAVPVAVTLPGAVVGFQFALALKSKVPPTGPATVGLTSQVAFCAEAGDIDKRAQIRPATIAKAADAVRR